MRCPWSICKKSNLRMASREKFKLMLISTRMRSHSSSLQSRNQKHSKWKLSRSSVMSQCGIGPTADSRSSPCYFSWSHSPLSFTVKESMVILHSIGARTRSNLLLDSVLILDAFKRSLEHSCRYLMTNITTSHLAVKTACTLISSSIPSEDSVFLRNWFMISPWVRLIQLPSMCQLI